MLLQALAHYADTDLSKDLADEAFELKPVAYLVGIDEQGTFLSIQERTSEQISPAGKKGKTQRVTQSMLIPKSPVNRNSGVYPLLGADSIQYVVGPSPAVWSKAGEQAKHEKHHEAFVELIREASAATNDLFLQACCRFYDRPDQVALAREALEAQKPRSGINVTLQVFPATSDEDDEVPVPQPVVERPAVKEFWRRRYQNLFAKRHEEGGEGICMISGEFGPVAVTHDKIKGAANLGGQPAGVSLMSFDKEAFCSYGWRQNQNGPVSPDRARAYVLAFNDLMQPFVHRQGRSRKLIRTRSDIGGMAYLYWTRDRSDIDVAAAVESKQEDELPPDATARVAELLDSPYTSKDLPPGEDKANLFHLLGVSGNGGRLVVHDWHWDSLGNVWNSIQAWRENLQAPDVFNGGKLAPPPGIFKLIAAIKAPAEKMDSKLNGHRRIALMRRALFGQSFPLGISILAAALERLRAEKGSGLLSCERIGLIRFCINDSAKMKGKSMSAQLDPTLNEAAYVCGRLLAYYDDIQRWSNYVRKLPPANVTLADRLFAPAMMQPGLVMPKIEKLGKSHLAAIRGRRPGWAKKLEKEISEIATLIKGHPPKYPVYLSLERQGCFALGFHHQKAINAQKSKSTGEETSDDESLASVDENGN